MQRRRSSLVLALALSAGAGCNKNNPANPAPRAHTPAVVDGGARAPAAVVDEGPLTAPSDALFVLRGSGLRKVLNIIAPGAPTRLALGQVAPSYSPGIGEHGVDVDPDAPFAAIAMPHTVGERGRLQILVAWPLRSGMQIAQDAQAGRGYREVLQGIYESTAAPEPGDAGAVAAENPCWVARKQPVGWMLVCGPRDMLRSTANFLVRAGSRAPEGDPVLDVTLRPEAARPVLATQIAGLEAQDPRRAGLDAGAMTAMILGQYDQIHRTAMTYKEVADDLRTLHASLTIDESNYHLRAEAEFANATGANTRALLASTVGRHAAVELLGRLPTTASSYLAMSLDGSAAGPLLGAEDEDDPRMAQAVGPEFMRFQRLLRDLTSVRRAGERAIGFMVEEGGTKIEVMRAPDAVAQLTAIRTAAAAVPRTPRASGVNPGEQFAILPNPAGLPAGTLRLRLNPDPARLPPNAPAEMRRIYSRTTLLVPEGDKLYLIEAQDPVARWNAMQTGQRLAVTVPETRAGLAHLSPMALLMLLGVPATEEIQRQASGEPMDGTLTARRVGDAGAHFELSIDAPIVSLNQARDIVAQLQAQQAQAMQQQQEAQQRAMQAMQAARRQGGPGPRGPGLMVPPTPSSPDQLPEPDFQLRPPGQ
ncbi:MAG: hypothetical protein U0326_30565 [Polyangiales bacterium]